MKKLLLLMMIGLLVVLAACSATGTAVVANTGSATEGETAVARLNDTFNDALPIQSQLAVGTLQLESTDLAVDETAAAELLPLWRALQSLSNSETTADVEITAVLNQIQDAMTPEQISAIAAMQLTQEGMQTMITDGTLVLGGGGFGANRDSADTSALSGLAAGAGGGPGGGLGGGMPGGGMPAGGDPGAMGGGFGGDPGAMATRMAATGEDGDISAGGFQVMAMTNSVIRLLETKTGDVTMPDGFGPMNSVITAVAEATGLSEDDVRTAAAEGQTFAEIIEANGGDVTAVTAQLIESLQDSPMLQDQDPEEFVTGLLNGSMNGRPGN